MAGSKEKVSRRQDPLEEHFRIIRRTNETGLGSRSDYEHAFGATAAEQRESWIAPAPFYTVLREKGVHVGGVPAVAMFRPDEPLPQEIVDNLQRINEVVEATPIQVLHMREVGGARAEEFSVSGRMEFGILMVIVGDVEASRVRRATWKSDDQGGWTFSRTVYVAAQRFGLTERDYISMSTDPGVGLLPHVDSERVAAARAKDAARRRLFPGVWISYASMTELVAGEVA